MKSLIRVLCFLYITFSVALQTPAGVHSIGNYQLSDPGQEYYKAALEAARRGDDEQAVASFTAALEKGYNTSRLHYNLGVVLLRLEQHSKAARAFRRAATDPELAALAEYNLGLIALRSRHWLKARDKFNRAADNARTPQLHALSARALERLPPAPKPYMLLAELSAGYDDAASISSDGLGGGEKEGDLFAGVWLYAEYWMSGNAYRGVQIFGSMYMLSFSEESDSDLILLETGAGIRQPVDIWETGARITGRHNRLDGNQLENSVEFAAEGSRLLFADDLRSGPLLSLRYRLELIDGGSRYAYLRGTKQDIRTRISLPLQKGRLVADYTIEHNDRDDVRTETQFTSASPQRHRFAISYRQPLNNSWHILTAASWRTSRFSGKNTLEDGTTKERKDRRLTLSGKLSYRHSDRLTPFLRGEWISNSSNIAYYDYDQARISTGAEWLF